MIKPLTSLRFFFAIIVFLSHLEWVPTVDEDFSSIYDHYLREGFLGVSFFFILSGFLLALNYKKRILSKKISFREFWIARIARIYPLHFFTLIYSLPIFFTDIFKVPWDWLISFFTNLFLLQSFVPDQNVYFGFNAVAWSISNEMFYYFMFPLLILLLYRFPKIKYLFFSLFIIIPLAIYGTPDNWLIYFFSINPVVRIADFILGILLYRIFERRYFTGFFRKYSTASMIELGSICLFILFYIVHERVPIGYRMAAYYWLPMSCIIYAFANQTGIVSRILSFRWFVFLGEISFSFYMLHALTMRYIKAVERRIEYSPDVYFFVVFIFGVILLLSILSYRFIELPFNKGIRNRLMRRQETTTNKHLVEELVNNK